MDRPTHELTTANGHTVVLHDYLTGGERQYISEPLLQGTDISLQDGKLGTMSAAVITAANNRTIEKMVVSLDGSAENVLSRVLDLREEDFQEIVTAINTITEGKKKEPNTPRL
jgi:hypothetical protein